MQVREKQIWCPVESDVTVMKVCFSPPPRSVLLDKLVDSISQKHQVGEVDGAQLKPLENLITVLKGVQQKR